ncbi:MAG: caspase family protein [Rhodospirillales bacterium]|nr:caspase family protein [Rhodospirillales bacterium]
MGAARFTRRVKGLAAIAIFAATVLLGGPPPAAGAETVLAPADYKPLPVGTRIRFDNRVYEVTETKGFETLFKVHVSAKKSFLSRSSREEGWIRSYGLLGEIADNMHVTDTRGDFIEYEIEDDEQEKLKAFWPLQVGKKATFKIAEGKGECTDPDEWEITLEVKKAETLTIGGIEYKTFLIEENGKSDTEKIYKGRKWYHPPAGIIIKAERDWIKSFMVESVLSAMSDMGGFGGGGFGGGGFGGGGGGVCAGGHYYKEPIFAEGDEDSYSLVKVSFPEGTTTHALKGIKPEGGAEAVLAEVRGLKKEVRGIAENPELASLKRINFGNYHALVIGINDYKNLPVLKTAINDAEAVAKVLTDEYGFKTTVLRNPGRSDIIDTLDKFRETMVSKDNLLIYYAGHGWLDKEADRGYWLPVDAKSDRRSQWVSNATITDTLKTLQAKHVMVVADSCYSGTLARSAAVGLKSGDYFKRMSKKAARVALVSGGLEPVADKGAGGHSPFANAFIKVLKENGDFILDGTKLFSKVRRPVMVAADQTPSYSDVKNAGHDGGDFLFVRKK